MGRGTANIAVVHGVSQRRADSTQIEARAAPFATKHFLKAREQTGSTQTEAADPTRITPRTMSDYDRRLHDALMRLGSQASAADIAVELGRASRGMHASLQAATARVDWLEHEGTIWRLKDTGTG